MLNREDGRINWNKTAEEIYNQIRALNPEPGTWTTWNDKILNIRTVDITDNDCGNKLPGTTEKINLPAITTGTGQTGNYVAVATKKCYLILRQIQLEGRKEMDAVSFINGHPDFLNSQLL